MHLNPVLINSYLNLVYQKDEEKVQTASKELRTKLFKLKMALSSLHLFDNKIYFAYKMIQILSTIESINKSTGAYVGLRINFIVIEQLKIKYQKLKYRYNQIYHIKSKNFEKIQMMREKFKEFQKFEDKFSHEFCLFLTPTFNNKRVGLLNSEIEEFNQKQIS